MTDLARLCARPRCKGPSGGPSGGPLALLLALVPALAGCSFADRGPPPPCPVTFPVAEAREVTRFVGPGRDLTDVLFEAQLQEVTLVCGYDDGVIESDLQVRIVVVDGPANRGRDIELTYFVAIATQDRKIVAREEFLLRIPFEGNRTRVAAIDVVSPRIPLRPGQTGADYVVYVGLALTPAELKYNQDNR